MAYLSTFEYDIFISYSHVDNRPLTPGQRGWIDAFHQTLEVKLDQVLDKDAAVWRDESLPGHEQFDESLPDRVREAAILVSVVSPRYLNSPWCLKELKVFCDSAEATGGLLIGARSRIFKVIKLPVDVPEPVAELRGTVGYDFYERDRKGVPHELDPDLGDEARLSFRRKVDDVAYHIRELLKEFGGESTVIRQVERTSRTVYLAESTWDLREEREMVRRELRQRGFRVLPEEALPHTPEFRETVRDQLRQAELSVHLLGSAYGVVPEQESSSVAAIQYALAGERIGRSGIRRIVWIPATVAPADERQKDFLLGLKIDSTAQEGTEILEGAGIEDLKTTIHDVLERSTPKPVVTAAGLGVRPDPIVYIICDPADLEPCLSVRDFFITQGVEAILPLMEGDEAEVRDDHQANLVACDAALIFWGRASEAWLRTQFREILKASGYGRARPIQLQGLYLGAPSSPAKERFRTRNAIVMQEGTFSSSLRPFLDRLLPAS